MKQFVLLSLTFVVCSSFVLRSQTVNDSDTISFNSPIEAVSDTIEDISIFDDDAPMALKLKYDITSFLKNKMKGEYLDAELTINYKDDSITKNIRLKARGNNRKKTCFFPPIYLNFKTDPIEKSELEGYKKVKLVTHCSTSKMYHEYVLKEYLVYKLYNVISENSFRVKMVNIEYVDTGKKERNYTKHGILIEPVDLLAKRRNAVEIDGVYVRGENVIQLHADRMAFFQYMIGNTDWRLKSGHNTKFLKSYKEMTSKVIPVPYDFDYAGFVGTHYGHPQTWTSIETTKEREYMGYCRSNDEAYLETIDFYRSKKTEILETINSFTLLSERSRKDLINYIEDFYALIDNPKYFLTLLRSECRSGDF